MELNITNEKENALFNRKEISGTLNSDISPSRRDTIKILAEKFKSPEGTIKIKKITGKFGSRVFSVKANIYSSEEDKNSIELEKKKDKKVEEAPVETAPVESTPVEKSEAPVENKESAEPIEEKSQEETKLESDKAPTSEEKPAE